MSASELALHDEVHALYSDHHGWLQGWLRRRLGNTFDAADLAQDVFMRLVLRRQPIQAREPRAFLSTIANGLVIEHWRRRELELAWLETLAAMPEPEEPSPESRLIFLETLMEIDRVLDALKPAVRTALLPRYASLFSSMRPIWTLFAERARMSPSPQDMPSLSGVLPLKSIHSATPSTNGMTRQSCGTKPASV